MSRLQEGKLNATKLDFFRRADRKAKEDRVRCREIRRSMGIGKVLVETVDGRRLQWFGHVVEVEEGRLPKEVMGWTPEGRNIKGNPTGKGWMK